MTPEQQLINLYEQRLQDKTKALEETRERLIEANTVIYEISKLGRLYAPSMHGKEIKKIIDNYLNKIK